MSMIHFSISTISVGYKDFDGLTIQFIITANPLVIKIVFHLGRIHEIPAL